MAYRKAVGRGKIYPKSKEEIINLIEEYHRGEKNHIHYNYSEKRIIGGIVPHGEFVYSAPEAIHFFEIVKRANEHYDVVVILHPNLHNIGEDMSLSTWTSWSSPLGQVEVDLDFQNDLLLPFSNEGERGESSGEIMLPFLKYYLNYNFKIVPISINRPHFQNTKWLGKKLVEIAEKQNKKILLIASSNFSHYKDPDMGLKYDDIVLSKISELDSTGLKEAIDKYEIDISGYGSIMTLIEYSKEFHYNPKKSTLKKGHSSYEVEEKVDYITVLFYCE